MNTSEAVAVRVCYFCPGTSGPSGSVDGLCANCAQYLRDREQGDTLQGGGPVLGQVMIGLTEAFCGLSHRVEQVIPATTRAIGEIARTLTIEATRAYWSSKDRSLTPPEFIPDDFSQCVGGRVYLPVQFMSSAEDEPISHRGFWLAIRSERFAHQVRNVFGDAVARGLDTDADSGEREAQTKLEAAQSQGWTMRSQATVLRALANDRRWTPN